MTVLRIFAIISSLFIISTSSAPKGIELGIKSKVYFGRDDGIGGGELPLPTLNVKMPGFPFNMKTPRAQGPGPKQQQFPFQMSPQIMKMMMAMMKPAIESGIAQQFLGSVM